MKYENNTDKYNDQLKISKLVVYFASVITILVSIAFVMFLNFNSNNIFFQSLDNFFNNIPLGNFIYLYLQSLNEIDFNYINSNIFSPALLIETIYLMTPIIILQLIIIFFYRRTSKKDHSFVAAFIGLVLLFSMIYIQFNNISLFRFVFSDLYSLKNTVLSLLMIIQLIGFISTLFLLNRLDRFSLSQLKTHNMANKFIKMGAIITSISFAIFGGILLYINNLFNILKDQIAFEKVVDISAKTDGLLEIDIPNNISEILARFNIILPENIDVSLLVERLGISEFDLGIIINNFIINQIDKISNYFIIQPLVGILIAISIIIIIMIFEYGINKIATYQKLFIYFQLAAVLVLYFVFAKNYGIIITFTTGLIVIGSIIHLITYLEENGVFKRLFEKAKDLINKKG